MSKRAGLSGPAGFLIGTALGPLGLVWLAWRGRGQGHGTAETSISDPTDHKGGTDQEAGFLL
jgi:hypothetical protein